MRLRMEKKFTSVACCSDIDELSMCGVGIIIKRQPRGEEGGEDDDELVVAAVPEGESAALDGTIKQGDIITSIAVREHTSRSFGHPHFPQSPMQTDHSLDLWLFFCL